MIIFNGINTAKNRSTAMAMNISTDSEEHSSCIDGEILQRIRPGVPSIFHSIPVKILLNILGIKKIVIIRSLIAMFTMNKFIAVRMRLFLTTTEATRLLHTSEVRITREYATAFATLMTSVSSLWQIPPLETCLTVTFFAIFRTEFVSLFSIELLILNSFDSFIGRDSLLIMIGTACINVEPPLLVRFSPSIFVKKCSGYYNSRTFALLLFRSLSVDFFKKKRKLCSI